MAGVTWEQARGLLVPLGTALLLGLAAWAVLAWASRRLRGRQGLVARVARVLALPMAFLLPLLCLLGGLRVAPLAVADARVFQHGVSIGVVGCITWLLVRAVNAGVAAILREHRVDVADNLEARRIHTQARVLGRVLAGLVVVVGVSVVLLSFDEVKQVGRTLLASAGILGLVAGMAAKPVFGNLIAGLQIALAQPIRLDDVVIVEGEWGRIEEITSTFVVVHIWDERRMVLPLTWFIEHPFQNWTRRSAQMLGTVFLWLDYRTPMAAVRGETERACRADPRWDGRVAIAQVTETSERCMQVRLLVSARNSGDAFDLRCAVREQVLDFLAREHPYALPRVRAELHDDGDAPAHAMRVRPDARQTRSPGAEDGPPRVAP